MDLVETRDLDLEGDLGRGIIDNISVFSNKIIEQFIILINITFAYLNIVLR